MNAKATVVNPQNIEVTIEITMPIGHWLEIREALTTQGYWPCGKFRDVIRAAVEKVQQQVYVSERDLL